MGVEYSVPASLGARDDGLPTHTHAEQSKTERECARFILPLSSIPASQRPPMVDAGMLSEDGRAKLLRERHVAYSRKGLLGLSSGFVVLDASRPWLVYWILHALELLGSPPLDRFPSVIDTLRRCLDAGGGFGGGPGQAPHTAPTYASVLSLATIGSAEALGVINRPALYRFFMRLKSPSGGFHVQDDGEMDTRGLYTVLAVASLTNMLTPELAEGVAEFVGRCQTFEGGVGGEPGNEAHGGYAFCGVAALVILNRFDVLDMGAMLHWIAGRQMRLEGGFQGRTNKLVDACYSFWQGAIPALLQRVPAECFGGSVALRERASLSSSTSSSSDPGEGAAAAPAGTLLYDQLALQRYTLLCAQQNEGGLRDKPGKGRDHYHTCYALSGLSVAQHCTAEGDEPAVWGDAGNLLVRTDPVYNVSADKAEACKAFFAGMPSTHAELMGAQ